MNTEPGTINLGNPLRSFSEELLAAPRVWVAYSGGMDSTLLLHWAQDLLPATKLNALHVNHGIHQQAQVWQEHCAGQARQLGVKFVAERVELEGERNLEARARAARYRVFAQKLEPGDILLMAHHANDQAETFLLRLLRGAGLRGLAGMPQRRPIGAGTLLRPALFMQRYQLCAVAESLNLSWVEDATNEDLRFRRNFLRHEVIPRIEKYWPAVVDRITHSVQILNQGQLLLDDYAEELAERCDLRLEIAGTSLDLNAFNIFEDRKRQLLLRWLLARHFVYPEQSRLNEILRQLEMASAQSRICEKFFGLEIGVFRQRLYFLQPLRQPDCHEVYDWEPHQSLEIPELGCLKAWLRPGVSPPCRVTFRSGGERCHPLGRRHSQTLKHILQELGVPPWVRGRLPIIYRGDVLIAVAGLFSCVEGLPVPEFLWREEPRVGQGAADHAEHQPAPATRRPWKS